MVRAKREYEGSLFAWHASLVVAFMPFTGRRLNPNSINPYRERNPEAEANLEAVRRFIAGMGFKVLAEKARNKRG
jgi:hypothetical protein